MQHEERVRAFLASLDQQRVAEVERKYPCLSSRKTRSVRRREVCVGLLGLSPARIPFRIARTYGYPNIYDED